MTELVKVRSSQRVTRAGPASGAGASVVPAPASADFRGSAVRRCGHLRVLRRTPGNGCTSESKEREQHRPEPGLLREIQQPLDAEGIRQQAQERTDIRQRVQAIRRVSSSDWRACQRCSRGPVVDTTKNGSPTLTPRVRSKRRTGILVSSGLHHPRSQKRRPRPDSHAQETGDRREQQREVYPRLRPDAAGPGQKMRIACSRPAAVPGRTSGSSSTPRAFRRTRAADAWPRSVGSEIAETPTGR